MGQLANSGLSARQELSLACPVGDRDGHSLGVHRPDGGAASSALTHDKHMFHFPCSVPSPRLSRRSTWGNALAAAFTLAAALPAQTLWWTEQAGFPLTQVVKRQALSGGPITTMWSGGGQDVEIDVVNSRLFWAAGNMVRTGAADGTGLSTLVQNHTHFVQRVDYVDDGVEQWVYWTSPHFQRLSRTRLSDNWTQIIAQNYHGFTIDDRPAKLHLYTCNSGAVTRSALDGTGSVVLATLNAGDSPAAMVVDKQWNVLWLLGSTQLKLQPNHFWLRRIDLTTGQMVTRLESSFAPLGQQLEWQDIEVDCVNGEVYWTARDAAGSRVFKAARAGTSPAVIHVAAPSNGVIQGLALDPGTTCAPESPPAPAGGIRLGQGCYAASSAAYWQGPAVQLPLAQQSLSWLLGANGYVQVAGQAQFVPPSGMAASLGLTDDAVATVVLPSPLPFPGGLATSLEVCDNGFVSPLGSNGVGYLPDVAHFLGGSPRWACWHDFAPTAAGDVVTEAIGDTVYVTWNGVADAAPAAGSSTFQFQFDTVTGSVHLVLQSMSQQGGKYLVGWTPGGGALDGGSVDLVAAAPFSLPLVDQLPLQLLATAPATLGGTAVFTTTDAPSSGLGLQLFSLVGLPTGVELGFLGAPGCFVHIDTTNAVSSMISNLGLPGLGMSTALPIPAQPALVGVSLFGQSAWLEPSANPFGLLTSNAVQLTITP